MDTTTLSGVSSKTVERAISALLKWQAAKLKTQKAQLLEQDEFVYLILTLKKIPPKSRTNAHKVPLPHPLTNPQEDNAEFCLIIDDRPKSGLTKDEAKKKIQNDNVPISKIIKLSKLKTDYRPFEAKRKLCDSYDMFFADRRVIPLLPKMLGKQFFKKKKIPVPLDLNHKNWKEQIDKSCSSAFLFMRTGTCSVVKVGKVSMQTEDIVENVVAAINGIAEIVPRKWGGIRSFHLKLLESLALPVYQVLPDMKLKIEGVNEEKEEATKEAVKEKKVGKKKGRIHEIRYMDDVNDGENSDDDGLGKDDEGDVEDDNKVETEMTDDELERKNIKKGGQAKKEKQKMKMAKVKKENGIKRKTETEKLKNDNGIKQKKLKKGSLTLESGETKVKNKKKQRLGAE